MKISKRRLSLCLVFAMLISLSVYHSAFGNTDQTYKVLLTEDFEGDTNKFDANVSNVAFSGVSGKVGAIAYNNSGNINAVLDIEDVLSGGVRITFDAYLLSNGNRPIIASPAEDSSSSDNYELLQVFQRQVRLVDSGEAIYKASADGWVRVQQILNLDEGVVRTWVCSMDGVLLGEGTNNAGCDSIGKITFKNWGKSSVFNIDNIKVETCDPSDKPDIETEKPPVEEEPPGDEPEPTGIYISEDFEGDTIVLKSNCEVVEAEGVEGKVGAVIYNPTGGQYMSSVEFADIEGGGAKISYDLYLVGGQSHYIKAFPTTGKEYPLLQISGLGIGLTNGGAPFYTAAVKGWVRVEQIMKLESGLVETSIYSMDGKFLGKSSNNVGYNSIASITFCNWSASAKMNLYIDNLLVENYDVPPELTVTSFTKTDYSGNVIEDNNGVTPGIAKIEINFGTKMNGETLGGIKLKKDDGEEVKTTGSLSNTVYTLTLDEGLESNSRYKVTVPADVASSIGVKLGSSFSYEFGTGKGETAVSVAGLSKGEDSITALSQLAEGDDITISVGCGNLTEKELPVICVVTYYSGKSMEGIEAYALSAPTGYRILTQNIKMPALSGVDKIKVVALNDLYGMLAYNEPIVIE